MGFSPEVSNCTYFKLSTLVIIQEHIEEKYSLYKLVDPSLSVL
jgi:hypothetical protein